MTRKTMEWITIAFFAGLVALVFQQIHTSMTEQGIAGGGPYDNAASFPKAIAIAIALLLAVRILTIVVGTGGEDAPIDSTDLQRPAAMLAVFALYLGLLTPLGYHLTTGPTIFAVMWICGARRFGRLIVTSLVIALVAAFVFEKFLSVVLPGGSFALHMPW